MGKSKLATATAAPRKQISPATNVTPIASARKARASGAQPVADVGEAVSSAAPAVVVFGKDFGGKAHASRFGEADAELAIKAAGLMGYQVLRVTSPDIASKALEAPVGRIFASGKGFVPFCKMPLYETLSAFEGAFAPPPPPEPQPEPPLAVTGIPQRWEDLQVGSLVLASTGPGDGWFEAIIAEARGDSLFVLRWQGWPDYEAFVRRADGLALLPAMPVEATVGQ